MGYGVRWGMRFNSGTCGGLVVRQKKQKRLWKLGKETIGEVDEYKYLGVWINQQANGLNHIRHLVQKASFLYSFVREATFGRVRRY